MLRNLAAPIGWKAYQGGGGRGGVPAHAEIHQEFSGEGDPFHLAGSSQGACSRSKTRFTL